MTRIRARNVGTVALGTVLLGLGCTQRNDADQDPGLAFPEEETSDPGATPRKKDYPEPEFGPVARRAIEQRDAVDLQNPVAPVPVPREREAPKERKRALLETTSDRTLIAAGPQPPPALPASVAEAPPVAPNDNPAADFALRATVPPAIPAEPIPPEAASASDFASAFPAGGALSGGDAVAVEEELEPPHETLAGPVEEAVIWPEVDFTPDGEAAGEIDLQLADTDAASEAPVDAGAPAEQMPAQDVGAAAVAEPVVALSPSVPVQDATATATAQEEPARLAIAEPVKPGPPVTESGPEVPVAAPAPVSEPSSEPATASSAPPPANGPLPEPSAESQAAYAELIGTTSFVPPPASAPEEDETVRRRSIERRDTAGSQPDSGATEETAIKPSSVPELATVVPPRRTPIPMTTANTPQPDSAALEAANDSGSEQTLPPAATNTAELLPATRSQSILGLGTNGTDPEDQSGLTETRQSAFTASAQPPVLSYQDELILELKVKGVDAADTVIAYGTRQGVYLPLGTLARILDLALVVSDDGHYANGWVLEEDNTLTIDLRRDLLIQKGEEKPLPRGLAAAFDGEMYVLDRGFESLMPLRIETDLRSQAVLLETLQPFPFEERMKREADRRRLANRATPNARKTWPRQETPYEALTLPIADVELRAISDSAFGPRLESDLLLAGDVGFLTAQAFLSADTERGLTSSLIEVGRMDPDGDLLGPLAATDFAFGDVSTTSMPIGLRSVTGRGFTVTNTPPETVSVFEKIDLRGILQEGYEVELYRNDILIGSTREAVNGQYEFLQVPVDFGLNVFRLVFFGPQGQRSEQVRRITVGDGRLPQGKLVYRLGAVQKDENVLGVRDPDFIPARDFGTWRASGELAYGLTSDLTALVSGAWFETVDDQLWLASAGLRSGIGRFALKGDVAAGSGGALAVSAGVAGRFGNSAVTLSHAEYSGGFIDETRSVTSEPLRRATELDFNTTLNLGNPITGLTIPLTARARHVETEAGRAQTNVAMRASTRLDSFLVSNTLEYTRNSVPGLATQSQLFGNFDLATASRSKTRGRLSLGYQIVPDPDLVSAALEVDHAIDQDTAIRGSVGYSFTSKSTQLGLSAVRDFDRFTVALDGNYGFRDDSYSVGLRLGFSFGRDPLRGNFFIARPGLASSGGVSARAFRDMDGDGVFGPGDSVLPEIDFAAYNQTATTGDDGIARLTNLGEGRGVSIQVDTSTLPDIDLAAARQGIEVVPRPGRIHAAEFPIVAVSEVDGTVTFRQEGRTRGVSGVRLLLQDAKGETVKYARTEVEGYYFFERVLPGSYTIALDPEQSQKLNLCLVDTVEFSVGFEADLISEDVDIEVCN